MSAQINVYVPDEMKGRLEETSLQLSSLARTAWERELARVHDAEQAGEIRVMAPEGAQAEVELRFEGEVLVDGWIYRTTKGKAIILDWGRAGYGVWDADEITENIDGFISAISDALEESGLQDELRFVLESFGVTPVVRI